MEGLYCAIQGVSCRRMFFSAPSVSTFKTSLFGSIFCNAAGETWGKVRDNYRAPMSIRRSSSEEWADTRARARAHTHTHRHTLGPQKTVTQMHNKMKNSLYHRPQLTHLVLDELVQRGALDLPLGVFLLLVLVVIVLHDADLAHGVALHSRHHQRARFVGDTQVHDRHLGSDVGVGLDVPIHILVCNWVGLKGVHLRESAMKRADYKRKRGDSRCRAGTSLGYSCGHNSLLSSTHFTLAVALAKRRASAESNNHRARTLAAYGVANNTVGPIHEPKSMYVAPGL